MRALRQTAAAVALVATGIAAAVVAASASPAPAIRADAGVVLPTPAPLFATQRASGRRTGSRIGTLIGVGGLQRLGSGTTVSLLCVKGCTGSKRLRLRAGKARLQVRFDPPLRLSRGAVIELRATRAGATGRWQRYRMVRRAEGVFAELTGGGCLTRTGKATCPKSPGPAPTTPTNTTTPVTTPTSPMTTAPPAPVPTVAQVSPDDRSTVANVVHLVANATGAAGVEWQAYYATNVADASTRAWHVIGRDTDPGDGFGLDWNTKNLLNQGSGAQGVVNLVAIAVDAGGALTGARDYRRVNVVNYDLTGDGYVGCDDLRVVVSQYGSSEAKPSGDVNGDGVVDGNDLSKLLSNFYKPPGEPDTCP